ncbi:unnamed protein product, partial [Chrysoparadoxa australica]
RLLGITGEECGSRIQSLRWSSRLVKGAPGTLYILKTTGQGALMAMEPFSLALINGETTLPVTVSNDPDGLALVCNGDGSACATQLVAQKACGLWGALTDASESPLPDEEELPRDNARVPTEVTQERNSSAPRHQKECNGVAVAAGEELGLCQAAQSDQADGDISVDNEVQGTGHSHCAVGELGQEQEELVTTHVFDAGSQLGISLGRLESGEIGLLDVKIASAAAKAGLAIGDAICEVNGENVSVGEGPEQLTEVLRLIQNIRGAGKPISLAIKTKTSKELVADSPEVSSHLFAATARSQ